MFKDLAVRRLLTAAIITAIFLAIFTIITSAAGAVAVPQKGCKYIGSVNYYATPSDIPPIEIYEGMPSYQEYYCRKGEFRVYKSVANNDLERSELRKWAKRSAKTASDDTIFCETLNGRWYYMDLAYYYNPQISKMNDAEKTGWNDFVTRFIHNNVGCRRYR